MEEIETISLVACECICEVLTYHWLRHAFDKGAKTNHVINNMIDSFNSQLGAVRSMPILSLLEHVKRQVMRSVRMRYQKAKTWLIELPPTIQRKMEKRL